MTPKCTPLALWLALAFIPQALGGFELTDIDGETHRPFEDTAVKAVALVFVLPDCPIANQYQPKLRKIREKFHSKGIRLFEVHADPGTTLEAARKHRSDYDIPCPVLLDPEHEWVKRAGATVTPEAAVFNRNEELVYRGRIDDRFPSFGKKRFHITSNELEKSLRAIVDGEPVKPARTKAVGCYIPSLETK